MSNEGKQIAACILRLCKKRGPGKTICPSEVARALGRDEADWRAIMPAIRAEASALAREGQIVVLQKGLPVEASLARGPLRLGLPES